MREREREGERIVCGCVCMCVYVCVCFMRVYARVIPSVCASEFKDHERSFPLRVAVCCSVLVLQCVAVYCSVLQVVLHCAAACCSLFQSVAVCCSMCLKI